ncbi:MAG TPA: rod shape-determining protein MreD [Streptosporangiaceae bacterium]|nr:rod shape-determining protein MreD [Streptosporangiaceae bacterium]
MRKAWLAPVLIVISIVLQLTVLNGLRLPGGGVPDVVLVVVAALAVADGPLAGLIVGFAAGLCLDLAPPGSLLVGQYALVFCLAGWAAGRLGRIASKSPLWSVAFMAIVVAAAEALSTGIGLVLEPAQVTAAAVRDVLPATIGYDLVLCPFVLYLLVVAGSLLAEGLAAGAAAGGVRGVLTGQERTKRRRQRPHQPRLVHAAARTSDGWLSTGHDRHHGRQPPARTRARLRPASGVAGSASGLRHSGSAASASRRPPSLRLSASRRGDGAIGNSVGSGSIRSGSISRAVGRHPGMLAGATRQFRPRSGQPGGSATRQHTGSPVLPSTGPGRPKRGRTPIRFGGHRGDGALGRALGSVALARPSRPAPATLRLRTGTSRSALTTRSVPRVVPKVKFKTAAPAPVRRSAAAPRFRRSSGLRSSGAVYGLVSGGVLDHTTFRTARRRAGLPRLHLAAGRRASGLPGGGMLGGSGRSPLRGPRLRIGKQPRFGYGRRSLLSFLTGRRVGGSWLARKRAGSRSGGSLIGKWTGGAG